MIKMELQQEDTENTLLTYIIWLYIIKYKYSSIG